MTQKKKGKRQSGASKKSKGQSSGLSIAGIIILILMAMAFCVFAPASQHDDNVYLCIDNDDDMDSVSAKMDTLCHGYSKMAAMTMTKVLGMDSHLRPGRYAIEPSTSVLTLVRNMRNGHQEPMRLTLRSVRTMERLAEDISAKMMVSKEELMAYFESNDSCAKYNLDTATIATAFIPNTYEVYWNTSVDKLIQKMQKEADNFWNGDRLAKADKLGLSTVEVITLASIIDEETANNGEKPMIAGMYYNRLRKDMPLQADPTIKFAMKNFEAKRIYVKWLSVDSPYNTYKNKGLPPGPIRIPSVAGIDAVLNLVHHDYLYMCAKEDFSGTHNFARTYPEHLLNAAKYTKALNDRNIH